MDGSAVHACTSYALVTYSYAHSPGLRLLPDIVILPQRP